MENSMMISRIQDWEYIDPICSMYGIFDLHLLDSGGKVGQYTSPMHPMGVWLNHTRDPQPTTPGCFLCWLVKLLAAQLSQLKPYQVIQAVPFYLPLFGGHLTNLWKRENFTILKRALLLHCQVRPCGHDYAYVTSFREWSVGTRSDSGIHPWVH